MAVIFCFLFFTRSKPVCFSTGVCSRKKYHLHHAKNMRRGVWKLFFGYYAMNTCYFAWRKRQQKMAGGLNCNYTCCLTGFSILTESPQLPAKVGWELLFNSSLKTSQDSDPFSAIINSRLENVCMNSRACFLVMTERRTVRVRFCVCLSPFRLYIPGSFCVL